MLMLLRKSDLPLLPIDTPAEIRANITDIITKLNNLYGADRQIEDDGGYVVYLSPNDNIEEALAEIDIDLEEDTPEHVDVIGEFLNILYLFNNEYGVNLFLPKNAAPQSLLKEL